MGKAVVDLPDPLHTPPEEGRRLTSTDDLLAQLAGEEIDRLLAEVDDSSPATAVAAAPPAPVAPPVAPASPADLIIESPTPPEPEPAAPTPSLAELLAPADTTPPAPHDPAPAQEQQEAAALLAHKAAADVTEEIDALFAAARPPFPAPAAVTAAPAAEEAHETTAAERAGLASIAPVARAPGPSVPAIPGVRASHTDADADADPGPLPLYLRPLEWINAPLEACPAQVRDFVGKAAIITLVNAAAILVYVLVFRRG